jgi:hypothetical protein
MENSQELVPICIRTSDRITHRSCLRKWYLSSSLQRNLEPTRMNPTFWFGRGLHYGLDQYHGYQKDPVTGFLRFVQFSLDQYVEKTGLPVWDTDKHNLKDMVQLGRGMLLHYQDWDSSPDRPQLSIEPFKVIATEQSFRIPLEDVRPTKEQVYYTGRFDGIVQDKFGDYWLLEHKGYKAFDENKLILDDQVSSYIWAAQKLYGITIKGVIYNVLRKKLPAVSLEPMKKGGLSVAANQDTTYEAYRANLDYLGIDRMSYQDFLYSLKHEKGNMFFHRSQVTRSQAEIKNVEQQIYDEAYMMLYHGDIIYPNPTRDCSWSCDFTSVCLLMQDDGDYEQLLAEQYQIHDKSSEELEVPENYPIYEEPELSDFEKVMGYDSLGFTTQV